VIATQTAGRDFDTSDTPVLNDPSQRNSFIPMIHITVDGQALVYVDAAQVLNTGGFDPGQSENVSESAPWQVVGQDPTSSMPSSSAPADPNVTNTSAAVPASSGGTGNGLVAPVTQTATAAIAPLSVETRGAPAIATSSKIRRFHARDFAHERGHIRAASRRRRHDLRASAAGLVKAGAEVRQDSVARQHRSGTLVVSATGRPWGPLALRRSPMDDPESTHELALSLLEG
jgi:hypothetical protein